MGRRLVAVSNWDCSLPACSNAAGSASCSTARSCSAVRGARKPDPAIFAPALSWPAAAPDEALHVGDTPEEDVEGARAAGIRPLLIARDGGRGDISSLEGDT